MRIGGMMTTRIRHAVRASFAGAGILFALGVAMFAQTPPPGAVSISVKSVRPVEQAVDQLQSAYGWTITYEDVPVLHPDDIVDRTVRDVGGYKALDAREVELQVRDLPQPADSLEPATVIETVLQPNAGRIKRTGSRCSRPAAQ